MESLCYWTFKECFRWQQTRSSIFRFSSVFLCDREFSMAYHKAAHLGCQRYLSSLMFVWRKSSRIFCYMSKVKLWELHSTMNSPNLKFEASKFELLKMSKHIVTFVPKIRELFTKDNKTWLRACKTGKQQSPNFYFRYFGYSTNFTPKRKQLEVEVYIECLQQNNGSLTEDSSE